MQRGPVVARVVRSSLGSSLYTTQADPATLQFRVFGGKLLDLQKLVLADVGERLRRPAASGPQYFDAHTLRGLPQPDMLFQRRCAKGPSARDGAIDGAYSAGLILHGHFDPGSDGGPVGFHAH